MIESLDGRSVDIENVGFEGPWKTAVSIADSLPSLIRSCRFNGSDTAVEVAPRAQGDSAGLNQSRVLGWRPGYDERWRSAFGGYRMPFIVEDNEFRDVKTIYRGDDIELTFRRNIVSGADILFDVRIPVSNATFLGETKSFSATVPGAVSEETFREAVMAFAERVAAGVPPKDAVESDPKWKRMLSAAGDAGSVASMLITLAQAFGFLPGR